MDSDNGNTQKEKNNDTQKERKNVPRNKIKCKRNKNIVKVISQESSKIFSNMVTLETHIRECLDNENLSEEDKQILEDMRTKIFDMNMKIIETV